MSRSRPEYSIKVAESKDEIEACYDMRIEVFVVEQGFPHDTEIDEYDPLSIHLLLTTPIPSPPDTSLISLLPDAINPSASPDRPSTTSKPIGTIRFTPSLGKVGRLVVVEEYRKYGFGRVLVDGVDDYVRSLKGEKKEKLGTVQEKEGKKVVKLKLHSQMQVISFYEKMGYIAEGPVFDEEGAPHRLMVKEVLLDA